MCGYSTFPRLCNTTKVQLRTALDEFATCVVDLLVIGWMLVVQLFQEFSPTAAAAAATSASTPTAPVQRGRRRHEAQAVCRGGQGVGGRISNQKE